MVLKQIHTRFMLMGILALYAWINILCGTSSWQSALVLGFTLMSLFFGGAFILAQDWRREGYLWWGVLIILCIEEKLLIQTFV